MDRFWPWLESVAETMIIANFPIEGVHLGIRTTVFCKLEDELQRFSCSSFASRL